MAFSIFNISPENRFLRVLAKAVLAGFPIGPSDIPLSRWTILVPNRRSARALENILLEESGAKALLLPRIKPIGDIDEDVIADSLAVEGVPDAISKTDHLHAILSLLTHWAAANPDAALASDVLDSGVQAFALAQSLQHLVNQFETEDVDVSLLQGVYDLDLAGHRQNILELLKIITAELPRQLQTADVIGPAARRNMMIRLEAQHVAERRHKGPIIAAGSTGTNPATRDLLKAIAQDPMGAVVLPGLDRELDDLGWNAITPEHPQFALKTMLSHWGVTRASVHTLGSEPGQRQWLLSQALRPASVADAWAAALRGKAAVVTEALQQVALVEASDRQQEADVIALRLRQHLSVSTGHAALITPDRDLATRVKAALQRWNISIDDSAGEPLLHDGTAALLFLLLRCVETGFDSTSLFALLYHHACTFGQSREEHLMRLRVLELTGFRGLPESKGLDHIASRMTTRKNNLGANPHEHPLLLALNDEHWNGALQLAHQLKATLHALAMPTKRSLSEHIDSLLFTLENLAPPKADLTPADQLCHDVLVSLQQGSHWHPVETLARAQHSIVHALARETLRPPLQDENRLAIYGLAEARLIDVELAILGGLVDGAWPDRPDTGPWLNRPMRDTLKLQQPEREIGVTAHDFVQGFCQPNSMITWPKRLNNAPAIASRWVLRLQAVATAAGLKLENVMSDELPALARHLDSATHFAPQRRPQATPPISARPTTFSVTRVEKLVRDSYWIYAHNILKLRPLQNIGQDLDAALRGSLIHAALQSWAEKLTHVPVSEYLNLLLAKGEQHFQPFMDMPEVARFWWPRFERMATDFIEGDKFLRQNTISTLTELKGSHAFEVAGIEHVLTARADRIDITTSGALRIIDYKSGVVPKEKEITSGFAPQLTLEAALAARGGFKALNSTDVGAVAYIAVGGAGNGVEIQSVDNIKVEAEKAFANFIVLLTAFQRPETAYIPRHNLQKEDDVSDYDHLSRRLEWQLQGKAL
jgi:ATP-dependent helicase/nuclease subunit B